MWPWDAWAAVARQPEWSPQRVFAAEVLEKEVRLAYFQKVKKASARPGPWGLLAPGTGLEGRCRRGRFLSMLQLRAACVSRDPEREA